MRKKFEKEVVSDSWVLLSRELMGNFGAQKFTRQ